MFLCPQKVLRLVASEIEQKQEQVFFVAKQPEVSVLEQTLPEHECESSSSTSILGFKRQSIRTPIILPMHAFLRFILFSNLGVFPKHLERLRERRVNWQISLLDGFRNDLS